LIPVAVVDALDALAADCVTYADTLRAPLDAATLARRLRADLSAREQELLARWGYPFVLDAFLFHFSLTGDLRAVSPAVVDAITRAADSMVANLAGAPLEVDAISVLREAAAGEDFELVRRVPLKKQ
jgi:Protein of unknown function (DUF1045)